MPATLEELKVADQKGRVLLGSRYAGQRFVLRRESDGTAVLTPVVLVAESEGLITSGRLATRFAPFDNLKDNWDGHGSLAPISSVVTYAREVMALLQASMLARNLPWIEPHVGANERGEISLEWWYGDRALTIYVRSQDEIEYLKSWGSNIENDMEDGAISRIADFISLAHWLYDDASEAV